MSININRHERNFSIVSCLFFSVDATYQENIGRMINDAVPGSLLQNAKIKIVVENCEPHICLFAKREIKKGEEIRYDYGEDNLPWRMVIFIFL